MKNLGIIDIQLYFPSYYVDQSELETFDNAGKGKYTIGLCQNKMAFTNDREDINSICLTVLDQIMKKNNILSHDIARLEIGTETFVDKSKSIKTHLMGILENKDIEGISSTNACYGGTNALFNALNWMHSEFYDGKYAVVICADIAVYTKGRARPTGGCGALAILLGQNACIELEPVRSTYVNHVYDFYKPDPSSEYPEVDGEFSLQCYFKALESCYQSYIKKGGFGIEFMDYFCFHSPFSKMVEKAFYQLVAYDIKSNPMIENESRNFYTKQILELRSTLKQGDKIDNKSLELIKNNYLEFFKNNVELGLFLGKELGNIYTGSLYLGLLSLIMNKNINLLNKRIFMFSYGSGCAASLFTVKVVNKSYLNIRSRNYDLLSNLIKRKKISPSDFEKILSSREKTYLMNDYKIEGSIEDLFDHTFYLDSIDKQWRRTYKQKLGNSDRKVEFNKLSNKHLNRIQLIKNQLSSKSYGLPSNITMQDNIWTGFHKKLVHERLLHIKKVKKDVDTEKLQTGGLNLVRADQMIENCIGMISIPVGLGLNFVINSKKYVVPMAVEEPSIIAAVSSAAKLIAENGGFIATADPPLMISQVHIVDTDTSRSSKIILDNKDSIISYANTFCQEMVQRGGGVQGLFVRILKPSSDNINNGIMTIELIVNVCESMGANLLNTLAEKTADYIEIYIEGRVILKILSNLAVFRKAKSEFKIPTSNLAYKGISGNEMAKRIIEGYNIAVLDPFRTATHNKGIMNGIDAVAVALGQDWRAIEAAAHTYASINEKTYQPEGIKPLTHFQIIKIKNVEYLYGSLCIPISVGVVGGAIKSNENYSNLLKILGNPSASELSQIMVSVGLGQNLAALRALVSEGIQKGHMGLHAKNIAFAAGVPDYLIPDVVMFMKKNNSITERTAKKYLESHNFYKEMRKNNKDDLLDSKNLSTFYIEMDYDFLKEPIIMNILLNNKITPPIHFSIGKSKTDDQRINELFTILFEKKKTEDWLTEFIKLVHHFDFSQNQEDVLHIFSLKYKVKMIIILFYVISMNLLKHNFTETKEFIEKLIDNNYNYDEMLNHIPNIPVPLCYGLSVILEFYEIMRFYLNNYVKNNKIVIERLFLEIKISLKGFINMYQLLERGVDITKFNEYFDCRIKRLNATNMILADFAFSEMTIDQNLLDCLISLGRYCEIKLTLLRDFARHKEGSILNSYSIFSKIDGNTADYFNLRREELEILKEKFEPLRKHFKDLDSKIESISQDAGKYYKLHELPKF